MLRWRAISAALAFAVCVPWAQAAQRRHLRPAGNTSKRWSGYALVGTHATQVTGSWRQPAVQCARQGHGWASAWVGIDGAVDRTVQQIGTEGDCLYGRPRYSAWYEIYPAGIHAIRMPVAPGLTFSGEVSYVSGAFVLTLEDASTGQTFWVSRRARRATRTSVEWVMEGPPAYGLADFGSIMFNSLSATIDARTGPPSAFAAARRHRIKMIGAAGAVRANASVLRKDAFSITWRRQ